MQEDNSIISSTNGSSVEKHHGRKVVKKNGQRIGYYYIITKSLKESQKNDVMKCIYIKGLFNFGTCVIKEGTRGDSKDKHGRDIIDRLTWQKELHKLLQNKVRVPRLIDTFEENGNYYLVIERIKGHSLIDLQKKYRKDLREGLITRNKLGLKFLAYLTKITALLKNLHTEQVVHRDATSNNFMITPSGDVALIDLELSYSLRQKEPTPPYQLGTHGFMSPQQITTQAPTFEEDIFALGAILFQIWTNISPSKISGIQFEKLGNTINFFVPDKQIAEIITQSLHPEPDKRPETDEILKVIHQYRTSFKSKEQRLTSQPISYEKAHIINFIQQGINSLSSPLLADPEKGWFAEKKEKGKVAEKGQIEKSWYASYSKGAAGIVYMLSQAKIASFDISATIPYIQKGLDLIHQKYIDKIISCSPGLHNGSAGIAATLAHAINAGLIPLSYIDYIDPLLDKGNDQFDISQGTAGQGISNLICLPLIDAEKVKERLYNYAKKLLDIQQRDGSWLRNNGKASERATVGFANGVAGIVHFLLEYGERYKDQAALAGAEAGLNWLLKKGIHKNRGITWRSPTDKELEPWWSQGETGIALAFIKAHTVFSDPRYKAGATGALLSNPVRIVSNALGQEAGLSGLGEVYLEAYRSFKEPIWLERADWITQHILQLHNEHLRHGIYWITNHERQPVPTFMKGISGILHFLIRYCHPDMFSFPMLPRMAIKARSNETQFPIQHTHFS
ncbi:protein kinase/lanthionine synthetase C family protein [Chitinophaga sp. CF418]|uniref:protein kinase/lanthionine synthetase C family protein n=1 Tax=Chitinophaga sp. CF418 TaxID=1855287 RepID=UPI0009193B6B|nr:protein kinase/lanthionine synthetase C family protein [Chitinophaga sp. CF418]SHM36874.1 Serine/threonine protein kinase [Chitinophaga sp. CF418]